MNFDFAKLERRVSALEAASPSSLRFGRVTAVTGGKARVQFRDGQGVVTMPLSTVQARVLNDQDIKMPDVGEPVVCLLSGQGQEQGVILGAYYNAQEQDPGQKPGMDYHRYADGTELWYDRENHKLVARVQGHVEVEAKETVTVRAEKEVRVQSAVSIELKAPHIRLAGVLSITDMDGKPGKGELWGDYSIRQGGLAVPDNDVTAGAVSLRGHTHEGVTSGPSTTGRPTGG
ncbi:MAG: phage baseplate assembly protein V [Desulfovibrio sp.]|nr:phage baseplate assembly protein V [Desulfovibrio sp.]